MIGESSEILHQTVINDFDSYKPELLQMIIYGLPHTATIPDRLIFHSR